MTFLSGGIEVITSDCTTGKTFLDNDVIVSAARLIRNKIIDKYKDEGEITWPSEILSAEQ